MQTRHFPGPRIDNAPPPELLLRWATLFIIFDGDPHAWLSYLESEGSDSQRDEDLPFARALARRCADDSALSHQLRGLAQVAQ